MAIGETFLGSFFQVLLNKLASMIMVYAQRESIGATLLHKYEGMVETINAEIDDAAKYMQLYGRGLLKLWLDDVKDLAYDMEDLLNECKIEAAQAKLEAEASTRRGQVKRMLSFFRRPRSLAFETRLHEVEGRFKFLIINKKDFLSQRENVWERSHYAYKRYPITYLPKPQFFGREKEEAELLELLTCEAKNVDTTLSIVPIVGMGGIGKTALAQRLYNDVKVSSCFEIRAWVCVSDVFDVLNITKTILWTIKVSNEGEDLNRLQVKLKDSLSGKKFLVVLDDVWNEDYREWTALLKPFGAAAKGSKIVVTTRKYTVASKIGASSYPLKELSLDNCTSLLAFHALKTTNFERHPNLETIGKKIAEKCKGSPLAAKLLGGLLRDEGNPDQWEAILNSEMRDLPMGIKDECIKALKLSYAHLPSYLKSCIVYCAIFPNNYKIERDELVHLWIAEGFLDGGRLEENLLKWGQTHFDELVSRSFLQQSSVDTSKFSIHILVNDLVKSIAGDTCFSLGESQPADNEDVAALEKVRHASFTPSKYVTLESLREYARMKRLRSLMLLHTRFGQGSEKFFISNEVLHDLLTKLKHLRVLYLCHCSIIEVPNIIGDLKYLRYLNFSYIDIERLPESIGTLCKLQALILRGCQKLSMLPLGIANSRMLSHFTHLEIIDCPALEVECFPPLPITLWFLRLDSCPKIKSLPNQWYHLTSLWRLEIQRCQNIECLPKGGWPPHLQELRISDCENLKLPVREWGLKRLTCLKTLLIDLSMGGDGEKVWFPSEDEDAWRLMFPGSLTSLYIKNMRNVERLSSNLRNHLSSLRELWIENCPKLRYLPEDGFPPYLQELHMLRRKILKD